MRIMGIDHGSKRIGVAISDQLLLTAQGVDIIQSRSVEDGIEKVALMAGEHHVDEIVVGLPLNMNGTDSAQTTHVRDFIRRLGERLAGAIPIHAWDERLTSMQAERTLIEGDVSRKKRRGLTDKIAAQLLLQGYLDARRSGRKAD